MTLPKPTDPGPHLGAPSLDFLPPGTLKVLSCPGRGEMRRFRPLAPAPLESITTEDTQEAHVQRTWHHDSRPPALREQLSESRSVWTWARASSSVRGNEHRHLGGRGAERGPGDRRAGRQRQAVMSVCPPRPQLFNFPGKSASS